MHRSSDYGILGSKNYTYNTCPAPESQGTSFKRG